MVRSADSQRTGEGHSGQEPNELIHQSSPYLRQHAYNPVRWLPWSQEALARAAELDRPIFLSVGYSTCHWCHVMERESFENDQIARLLNEHFVPIKVDREQRPDIDHLYMLATQMLTGQGGWPNSLWLTPDGRPWFAGTYFPPADRYGRPGFKTVLARLAAAWTAQREQIEDQADQIAQALRAQAEGADFPAGSALSHMLTQKALADLEQNFDDRFGGFGGAPKFPPHGALRLLLDQYRRHGQAELLDMIVKTLDQIALGGICDHVGGGFHRYATDNKWLLPHFEKMLYDNAQLIRSYCQAYELTGSKMYRQRIEECCRWIQREMTSQQGGFYAALDADSDGQEGLFYLWSYDEIIETIGPQKGECFAQAYGVRKGGNFRDEATGEKSELSILHLNESIDQLAKCWEVDGCCLDEHFHKQLRILLDKRDRRNRPARDEKILTAWNAMAIGALALASRTLDDGSLLEMALAAESFLREHLRDGSKVYRDCTDSNVGPEGFVEDYALLANAMLDLYDVTGQDKWLDDAAGLAETLLERFRDPDKRFCTSSTEHESLLARTRDPFDNATPAGSAEAVLVLARLAKITGQQRWQDEARDSLQAVEGFIRRAPVATTTLLVALETWLAVESRQDGEKSVRPVQAAILATRPVIAAGQSTDATLRLTIRKGWHVQADSLVVQLTGDDRIRLERIDLPKDVDLAGVVEIPVRIAIDAHAPDGAARADLCVGLSPCDRNACREPIEIHAPLMLQIAAGRSDSVSSRRE
ncbi:MAG: DUF255 domain-containing protein [Phycisphaerae bacterium]